LRFLAGGRDGLAADMGLREKSRMFAINWTQARQLPAEIEGKRSSPAAAVH